MTRTSCISMWWWWWWCCSVVLDYDTLGFS